MLDISVIVCTHNPRSDYLGRVVEALRKQSLALDRWELMIIDNASREPVSAQWDLAWHPHGRHVRENELGLTAARLKGIAEAKSELLVFVDDDNELDPDYLEKAALIATEFPFLGAWGGSAVADFEVNPPDWFTDYQAKVGVRSVTADRWSNTKEDYKSTPIGAGMVIRAAVARRYSELVKADPLRKLLDRRGTSLSSCGDTDMACTACDMGLGKGVFTRLSLRHLIPEKRMVPEYIEALMEEMACSGMLLSFVQTGAIPLQPEAEGWRRRLLNAYLSRHVPQRQKRVWSAESRGRAKACELIAALKAQFPQVAIPPDPGPNPYHFVTQSNS